MQMSEMLYLECGVVQVHTGLVHQTVNILVLVERQREGAKTAVRKFASTLERNLERSELVCAGELARRPLGFLHG